MILYIIMILLLMYVAIFIAGLCSHYLSTSSLTPSQKIWSRTGAWTGLVWPICSVIPIVLNA
jgi:hypothetical protein